MRTPWWFPPRWSAAWAVAPALATACFGAGAGQAQPRVMPANALPAPELSTEGYPAIGRAQVARIAEEVVGSTLRAFVRAPVRSAGQVVGRSAERLAVRSREISTYVLPLRIVRRESGSIEADLGDGAGGSPLPARLTLLPSSEAAIQGLLRLIGSARWRIDLMMYGWEDDPTGREVARALADRASQGVRVRLLVDRTAFLIHNAAAARGGPTFLDQLRTVPNVSVIEPPAPFVRFDHRKLAIFDGRCAWSGGMILTEVARRRWENLAFVAEGPVVTEYSGVFDDRWHEVGGEPEERPGPEFPSAIESPNATVRMVRTDVRIRSMKAAIFHAVDHARDHIYVTNPYFSDVVLAAKLVEARARGVDVRVVLTVRGNVKSLNQYSVLTANRLLSGGVRVYLMPGMTHVKAMSADGVWAYVGTGNFDELSLRNNREVGLSVTSPEVVRRLDESVLVPDQAASEELRALMPLPQKWLMLELKSLWF